MFNQIQSPVALSQISKIAFVDESKKKIHFTFWVYDLDKFTEAFTHVKFGFLELHWPGISAKAFWYFALLGIIRMKEKSPNSLNHIFCEEICKISE